MPSTVNFTITITGTLSVKVEKPLAILTLDLVAGGEYTEKLGRISTLKIPLAVFRDAETYQQWVRMTGDKFTAEIAEPILLEASAHLFDAANETLMRLGLDISPPRDAMEQRLHDYAFYLKRKYGVKSAGHASQWTRGELSLAIRHAFSTIPRPARSYRSVAEFLKKTYTEKAPATSEALRKLIKRLGVDWRTLKRESKYENENRTLNNP